MAVGVVQLDVKGFQTPQHGQPDPTRGNSTYVHRLQVIGPLDAIRDVPTAFDDPVVGRDVVAHEGQHHHDHVFGYADAIAVRHLGDGDATLHRRFEIDMIGADSGSHCQF